MLRAGCWRGADVERIRAVATAGAVSRDAWDRDSAGIGKGIAVIMRMPKMKGLTGRVGSRRA